MNGRFATVAFCSGMLVGAFIVSIPAAASAQLRWGRPTVPRDGACFYRDAGFRGEYFCVRAGEDLPYIPGGLNDEISSIRTFGRAAVLVFRDKRLLGPLRALRPGHLQPAERRLERSPVVLAGGQLARRAWLRRRPRLRQPDTATAAVTVTAGYGNGMLRIGVWQQRPTRGGAGRRDRPARVSRSAPPRARCREPQLRRSRDARQLEPERRRARAPQERRVPAPLDAAETTRAVSRRPARYGSSISGRLGVPRT